MQVRLCEYIQNFLRYQNNLEIDLHLHKLQSNINPLTPYGYSYEASCGPERQSARMSKITNDGRFSPVWHRMPYSCTHMAIVSVKELSVSFLVENNSYQAVGG